MEEKDIHRITIRVDTELHKKFKKIIIDKDSTITEELLNSIKETVNNYNKTKITGECKMDKIVEIKTERKELINNIPLVKFFNYEKLNVIDSSIGKIDEKNNLFSLTFDSKVTDLQIHNFIGKYLVSLYPGDFKKLCRFELNNISNELSIKEHWQYIIEGKDLKDKILKVKLAYYSFIDIKNKLLKIENKEIDEIEYNDLNNYKKEIIESFRDFFMDIFYYHKEDKEKINIIYKEIKQKIDNDENIDYEIWNGFKRMHGRSLIIMKLLKEYNI